MNDYIIGFLNDYNLHKCIIAFFGLFLFVWLIKLGINCILRVFDKS